MLPILDKIVEGYAKGVKYPKLKVLWQTETMKLYPQEWHQIKFPSRTIIWELSKHWDEYQCPVCEEYVSRQDTEEIFLKDPSPHWVRICRVCYLRYRMELERQRGHSDNLADYVSVKRGNITSYNPRRDSDED